MIFCKYCAVVHLFSRFKISCWLYTMISTVNRPQHNIEKNPEIPKVRERLICDLATYHLKTHWYDRMWLAPNPVLVGQLSQWQELKLPVECLKSFTQTQSTYFSWVCHFVTVSDSFEKLSHSLHSGQKRPHRAVEEVVNKQQTQTDKQPSDPSLKKQNTLYSFLPCMVTSEWVNVSGRSPWHPLRRLP